MTLKWEYTEEFDRIFYKEIDRFVPQGLPWNPFCEAVYEQMNGKVSEHTIWKYFKMERDHNYPHLRGEHNCHYKWSNATITNTPNPVPYNVDSKEYNVDSNEYYIDTKYDLTSFASMEVPSDVKTNIKLLVYYENKVLIQMLQDAGFQNVALYYKVMNAMSYSLKEKVPLHVSHLIFYGFLNSYYHKIHPELIPSHITHLHIDKWAKSYMPSNLSQTIVYY